MPFLFCGLLFIIIFAPDFGLYRFWSAAEIEGSLNARSEK